MSDPAVALTMLGILVFVIMIGFPVAITLMAPALCRQSLNGWRNVSRRTRSETFAGAQFCPDSG